MRDAVLSCGGVMGHEKRKGRRKAVKDAAVGVGRLWHVKRARKGPETRA